MDVLAAILGVAAGVSLAVAVVVCQRGALAESGRGRSRTVMRALTGLFGTGRG